MCGEIELCHILHLVGPDVFLRAERDHGVVDDDGDAVVQQGLAKDEEVEHHVDANLLKDGLWKAKKQNKLFYCVWYKIAMISWCS